LSPVLKFHVSLCNYVTMIPACEFRVLLLQCFCWYKWYLTSYCTALPRIEHTLMCYVHVFVSVCPVVREMLLFDGSDGLCCFASESDVCCAGMFLRRIMWFHPNGRLHLPSIFDRTRTLDVQNIYPSAETINDNHFTPLPLVGNHFYGLSLSPPPSRRRSPAAWAPRIAASGRPNLSTQSPHPPPTADGGWGFGRRRRQRNPRLWDVRAVLVAAADRGRSCTLVHTTGIAWAYAGTQLCSGCHEEVHFWSWGGCQQGIKWRRVQWIEVDLRKYLI